MINVKSNSVTEQKALEYIMYMMAGNIFNKCICCSKSREANLFLYYKEANSKHVISMEDKCAYFADEVLAKKLPKAVLESDVEALLIKGKSENINVGFKGRGWSLCIESYYVTSNKFVARVTFTTKSCVEKREYIVSSYSGYGDGVCNHISVKMSKGRKKNRFSKDASEPIQVTDKVA